MPSVTPKPSAKPNQAKAPVPSATPKPSAKPNQAKAPVPSATPKPSAKPNQAKAPAPSATPKPSADLNQAKAPVLSATPKPSADLNQVKAPAPSAAPKPSTDLNHVEPSAPSAAPKQKAQKVSKMREAGSLLTILILILGITVYGSEIVSGKNNHNTNGYAQNNIRITHEATLDAVKTCSPTVALRPLKTKTLITHSPSKYVTTYFTRGSPKRFT